MGFYIFLIGFLFCLFNLIVAVNGDYSSTVIVIHMMCMLINFTLLLNEILIKG